ncbi:MAG: hypothetical protein LBJ73_02115 [Rickettsiales bacterium]|jgi:hypothetical protein|nr:hypothetical protein [Rickettsiales bacterium]
MNQELHSFSDFAEISPAMEGVKKRMEEILNKPLIIRAHKTIASKRNIGAMCLHLQFEMDGQLCILFTGSAVLMDQCEKYADKMPFRAKIVKIDKYFTFS